MHDFIYALQTLLLQSDPALEAADQLFGPVGILLAVMVGLIISGMGYAIKYFKDRNRELRERNRTLTKALGDRDEELIDGVNDTLRDALRVMDQVETDFATFTRKYDRTHNRLEDEIKQLRRAVQNGDVSTTNTTE